MRKDKINLTLTPEARSILRNLATANGLSMSQVLELLIRGNKDVRFTKGVK